MGEISDCDNGSSRTNAVEVKVRGNSTTDQIVSSPEPSVSKHRNDLGLSGRVESPVSQEPGMINCLGKFEPDLIPIYL